MPVYKALKKLKLRKIHQGKKIELSKSNAFQELYRPASWTSERVYQLIYKLNIIYNENANMSIKFKLKTADFLIILIFLIIFFVFLRTIFSGTESPVLYISSPDAEYEYDLGRNQVVSIDGIIGKTTIVIKDKTVCISDSPCPNKTCVTSGKISKPGQWLSCAPNKIFVIIKNKNENAESSSLDAISF